VPEVRIATNLNVKPGTAEDYIRAWDPEYEVVNGQPGCLQFELFRSTRNPENLALLQHWQSRGGFHSYWSIQKVRPVAGQEFLDTPENRKVGRAGTEIYWDQKYYRYDRDAGAWVPAEGPITPEQQAPNDDPVRLVINQTARDGMQGQYADAWSYHYDEVNAEPSCVQYELFISTRNPQNMALLEHWATRKAFLDHWNLEMTRPVTATREFAAPREERKVGTPGLEIYWKLQYYRWDGTNWVPEG
jgi:quinol monooxygenase YgiN